MLDIISDMENDINKLVDPCKTCKTVTSSPTTFEYWKEVKSPEEMNMGRDAGDIGSNREVLENWYKLLITGDSNAQKLSGYLGDRYWYKTNAKCKAGSDIVDRWLYINNKPTGKSKYISKINGETISPFKGLIPGLMDKQVELNPDRFLNVFQGDIVPACSKKAFKSNYAGGITSDSKVQNYTNSSQLVSNYITDDDARTIDPCAWPLNVNTLTGKICGEGFTNMSYSDSITPQIPKDTLVKVYYASLGLLGLYFLYRMLNKK